MGRLETFNTQVEKCFGGELSCLKRAGLMLDVLWERLRYGTEILDYFQYSFYNLKSCERRNYVTFYKLRYMMKICNNPEHRYIFDQKPEFDKTFAEYLKRDFLNAQDADEAEFRRFIGDKDHFFVKQPDGMFGTGVSKIYVRDIENISTTFNEYKGKKYLLEETLTQCKEIAEFNDTSINTLRVVTVRKADGDVQVMGGLFRVGRKGKVADNFHHMGIAAFLDPCGVVCTTGVDKHNDRYVFHPDSGKQIVGFKVPMWDQVVDTVSRAAQVVPDVRYIGWDVVITEDYQVALVEGNPGADPDAEQITTGQGRWPLYWKLVKDIEARK